MRLAILNFSEQQLYAIMKNKFGKNKAAAMIIIIIGGPYLLFISIEFSPLVFTTVIQPTVISINKYTAVHKKLQIIKIYADQSSL